MPEYSTTQLAIICGKSERQVQRWIAEKKMKAEHIRGNIYSINEKDLEQFLPPLPRETVERLVERVELLETHIKASEMALTQLSGRLSVIETILKERPAPVTPAPATLRPPRPTYEASVTPTPAPADIPPGSMLYSAFARQHGVAEATLRDHIKRGHVSCIERAKHNRPHESERWLTPADQHAAISFWERNSTAYETCEQCPHQT